MRRLVGLALAAAALTSGCSGEDNPSPPPTTTTGTTTSTPPPPQDAGLRPVSLPYGNGLPYVPAETAAQAICQALPPERWQELLGSAVGRTIESDSRCMVTADAMIVRTRVDTVVLEELVPSEEIITETIADHEVRFAVDPTGPVGVTALTPAGKQQIQLYVSVEFLDRDSHPDAVALIRELFAALLPVLVHDGPKVPAPDADREVAYTPTAPVPGTRFVDLPGAVRGLVVCTALVALTNPPPVAEDMTVSATGRCEIYAPVWVEVTAFDVYPIEATQFTIAGRPAWETSTGWLAVDLDHGVLELQGDNMSREFAEQLLGKLGEL